MELILIKITQQESICRVTYSMAHYPHNLDQEVIAVYGRPYTFSAMLPFALKYLGEIPALYDTSKIRNQDTTSNI